mmetsp:Transcript_16424/g.36924  ORF Transcript_16424/g.36924 Transcript_16424/m.36924 type:complete len:105 (-) Transcript_16424:263-577(-)
MALCAYCRKWLMLTGANPEDDLTTEEANVWLTSAAMEGKTVLFPAETGTGGQIFPSGAQSPSPLRRGSGGVAQVTGAPSFPPSWRRGEPCPLWILGSGCVPSSA